jgi:dihydrofolate synthase/folylpolyglutamate synthase
MLAAVLQGAGYKTGLYTSPHIYDYQERIRINGEPIASDKIVQLDHTLTEFENLTALAFKYFADNEVDVVVLETGLGGRLDATNVIKKNLCAVITSISLDHTERLGATIEAIRREKEGIIKPGCPVIKNGIKTDIKPPLKGLHQEENLSVVLAVLREVFPHITSEIIHAGLKKTFHPARFQVINDNLMVDACHNPGGAEALRVSLDAEFPDRKIRFVFGCLENKDYEKMAVALFRPQDDIYFWECRAKGTFRKFEGKKFTSFEKLPQDDALVVVCGSIYMIKELIPQEILFTF